MSRGATIALVVSALSSCFWPGGALAQSHATDPEIAAELLDLEQRRAEASLRGPIIVSALGAGFFAGGAVLVIDAVIFNTNVCTDDAAFDDVCFERTLVRSYAIAGGVAMAVGAPLLSAGLPWLFRRLRTRRELGRRILELRGPVAMRSFDLVLARGRAGASATFEF